MAFPIDHDWREYAFYLRGPVGFNTFGFALRDSFRSGLWHDGRISVIPSPSAAAPDDFGIQTTGEYEVVIADAPVDEDWPILDANGDLIQTHNGTDYVVQDY